MKKLLLLLFAVISAVSLSAQTAPSVKGRVVDATTGAAIDFADVVITDVENNNIASTSVRGGEFQIDRVRDGEFVLTIMLVGYQAYISDPITFSRGNTVDVGTIALQMAETGLEEVVVTGEKS
ncbi:MAG: carboxypeptidase-like regulatory domain-containing protein, partial [Alistipes sp.]|nr:carboxypeptidase-like regulatory domain-containing protein [Alistipes sp.]